MMSREIFLAKEIDMVQKNILIASKNPHKQEMLQWIIDGFFNEVKTFDEVGIFASVEEEGKDFREIALNKAIFHSEGFDGYVIATDGGMHIPSLGDQWSPLLTHRFLNKEGASDFERMDRLLEMMKDKKREEREMIWYEALAIARNGQEIFSVQVEGAKGLMESGYNPAKYCPDIWPCSLWYFPEFEKNFFDLTEEERKQAENSWWQLRKKTRAFLKEHFSAPTRF